QNSKCLRVPHPSRLLRRVGSYDRTAKLSDLSSTSFPSSASLTSLLHSQPAASNATPSPAKSSLAACTTASSSLQLSTPTKQNTSPSSIPSTVSATTNSSSSTPARGISSKTC